MRPVQHGQGATFTSVSGWSSIAVEEIVRPLRRGDGYQDDVSPQSARRSDDTIVTIVDRQLRSRRVGQRPINEGNDGGRDVRGSKPGVEHRIGMHCVDRDSINAQARERDRVPEHQAVRGEV